MFEFNIMIGMHSSDLKPKSRHRTAPKISENF